MRKLILISVGALVIGALTAQLMLSVHGFWHIRAGHYDIYIRSFMGGVILLLLLFAAALLGLRLLRGVRHPVKRFKGWRQGVRQRRAVKRTNRGVEALGRGRWKKAEKLLYRTADDAPTPVVNYLFAAQAAHYQGDHDKAQQLLQTAAEKAPSAMEAIDLVKAELMLDRRQYEQALATLSRLLKAYPEHPLVLKRLRIVYERVNDWTGLRQILPRLERLLPTEEYIPLEATTYAALFTQLLDADEAPEVRLDQAQTLWRELPKARQEEPWLLAHYSDLLVKSGDVDEAAKKLCQGIEHHWAPSLLERYAVLPADASVLLKKAEAWAQSQRHDANVLLCLGRLSTRCAFWGKAEQYFEEAGRLGQNDVANGELARLYFIRGDQTRSTMLLAQSLQALHLPVLPETPPA